MFKSSALVAFLFLSNADAEGIKITSRSLARNEFVKKMRNSQKKHGKISRQLSFDAFINKSVHKPGLRTKKETRSHADAETEAGRKLNWWQWGGDSEEGAVEDADVDANQYYAASGNRYYDGSNAYSNGDDMWGYEEDKEYVVESLKDFSLKYAGCAATTSFSESEGEDGAYAFQNNNFVTYRLCPTESCNDNSWNGCKSTYGEYMMSLEDFLITQQDYVDLEFNAYCDFCKDCVYFTEFYSNGGNTKNNNGQGSCKYYEDCKDYGDSCDENAQAGEQKMEGDFDYEDFFECKEIDLSYYGYSSNSWSQNGNEDSNTVYAGPHCKEGTIQIGLFSDENCYNYIGNKYVNLDLSNFEYDALASVEELYVPEGCMSCDLTDTMEDGQQSWLSMYLSNSEEEGQQNPEDEYSGLTLICANLYMQSAKCNSHLMNYDNYEDSALQLSDNEYYSQTETCSFIENVMQGHISEQGWVGSAGNVTPWSSLTNMFGNPYTERVTAGQGVMLAASIMGSAYLGYMAFTLRKKLNSGDMQDDLIPAYDKELS